MRRALLLGFRIVEDRRHVGNFRNRRFLRADEEGELAVADGLPRRAGMSIVEQEPWISPRSIASTASVVPLVALDDAELGAEHPVEHRRQNAQRRSRARAGNDEFLREEIAGVLTGAVTQRTQTREGSEVCADEVEAPGIGLDVDLAHARLARHIARERCEHRPVPRRLRREEVGGDDARRLRHVLHHDGRLARNVLGEIACEEAPGQIIVVGRRESR